MGRRARPLAALVACAAFVSPLAIMLLGALHAPGRPPPRGLEIVPAQPSVAGFERAFELVPLGRHLLNSLTIVAFAVPLTVVCASLAGFAMTRLGRRAARLIIGFTLVALTIPLSALWVPRFVIYSEVGLLDSYVPLVLPALAGTTPFLVLLSYWSARRVPRDLVDAARLEGLGLWGVWRRVIVPLTRPTLFAVAALAFAAHWSNFIEPLLYLFDPDKATLPLGITALRELQPTDTPVLLAGALVAAVPPIVAFAVAQRQFLDQAREAEWVAR